MAARCRRKSWAGDFILAGLIALMGFPLLWMLLTALKSSSEIYKLPVRILPRKLKWGNFTAVWSALPFARLYLNSVFVALVVVAGQLLTSSAAGYVFAKVRFPGRDYIFAFYMLTYCIPDHVLIIPSFFLLNKFGLLNTYGGLTLPFLASPFGAFLMRQQFLDLPRELEEAAAIDGCGPLRLIAYVLLPALRQGLGALAVYVFIFSWNGFFWPLIMTSSASMQTLPLGLAFFQSAEAENWPVLMAAACLVSAPVMLAVNRLQKALAEPGPKSFPVPR
ncbi:MAG: carbohydrate ABC transporter permease [Firmicutes bacterium]|nr:carbohydrate ABC transporter permease [Bacillota bacterium]